jgi:hypothetical protein
LQKLATVFLIVIAVFATGVAPVIAQELWTIGEGR